MTLKNIGKENQPAAHRALSAAVQAGKQFFFFLILVAPLFFAEDIANVFGVSWEHVIEWVFIIAIVGVFLYSGVGPGRPEWKKVPAIIRVLWKQMTRKRGGLGKKIGAVGRGIALVAIGGACGLAFFYGFGFVMDFAGEKWERWGNWGSLFAILFCLHLFKETMRKRIASFLRWLSLIKQKGGGDGAGETKI